MAAGPAAPGPAARAAPAALLATLVLLSLHLRLRRSVEHPRYDPGDETGYFRAESALQYRHARMIARGEAIPEVDRDAQYPEGIRTGRELSLWMERATGRSFRLLPKSLRPGFRFFVLLWAALVSSLSIIPLYLLGLRLSRSPPLALAAAAAYGLSWAAQCNLIGTYRMESLGLPLLFASLAFLAAALDPGESRPRLKALGAGLFLASALGSWHFSRFFMASLWLAMSYAAYRQKDSPVVLNRMKEVLAVMLPVCIAAGLAVPSLRESALIASPAMILGGALWLSLAYPIRIPLIALSAVAASSAQAWLAGDAASYAHVYGLIAAKLRFLMIKPADPSLLTPEMRLMWSGPANSPDPGFLIYALLPLGLVLLPRLLFGRRPRHEAPAVGPLIDAFSVIYAAGFLLIARFMPILAFFLALSALRLPEKAAKSRMTLALLAAVAALEGAKAAWPASRLNPFMLLSAPFSAQDMRPSVSMGNELGLLDWLKRHDPSRPVLAPMGLSASILAYAGNPVLLQPKWEAPAIRAKNSEFLSALYSDEAAFRRFCGKYGARLFVHAADSILDETAEGPRYAAANSKLTAATAAFQFHFKPESLTGFRLVYENEDFRVYEVGAPAAPGRGARGIYDLARFNPRTLPDGSLSLDVGGVLRRLQARRAELFKALLPRLETPHNRPGARAPLPAGPRRPAAGSWPAVKAAADDLAVVVDVEGDLLGALGAGLRQEMGETVE